MFFLSCFASRSANGVWPPRAQVHLLEAQGARAAARGGDGADPRCARDRPHSHKGDATAHPHPRSSAGFHSARRAQAELCAQLSAASHRAQLAHAMRNGTNFFEFAQGSSPGGARLPSAEGAGAGPLSAPSPPVASCRLPLRVPSGQAAAADGCAAQHSGRSIVARTHAGKGEGGGGGSGPARPRPAHAHTRGTAAPPPSRSVPGLPLA